MDKKRTSPKQKKSLKNTANKTTLKLKKNATASEYDPMQELLDENLIGIAIWNCLKNNDPEGAMEVIEIHLEAVNKVQQAQKANIARSTMYHSLKGKNPTIKTLAKLIHACH
jgi:DNA-binding phage protein